MNTQTSNGTAVAKSAAKNIAAPGIYDVFEMTTTPGSGTHVARFVATATEQHWYLSSAYRYIGSVPKGRRTLRFAWVGPVDPSFDGGAYAPTVAGDFPSYVAVTCTSAASRQIDPGRQQLSQDGITVGQVACIFDSDTKTEERWYLTDQFTLPGPDRPNVQLTFDELPTSTAQIALPAVTPITARCVKM